MLNDDDYYTLQDNVKNTEFERIMENAQDDWYGSCYGMSLLVMLSKYNYLTYSDYTNYANCLYEVENPRQNSNVLSLITYYQLLQFTDKIQNGYKKFDNKSNKENLQHIIELLKTENAVMISYKNNKTGDNSFWHAVVAYGYEEETNVFNEHTYTGRIKIYDPNYSYHNANTDIYFDENDYSWIIPQYNNYYSINSKNAKFKYISADFTKINYGGMMSKSDSADNFISRINVNASSDTINVNKVIFDNDKKVIQDKSTNDIYKDDDPLPQYNQIKNAFGYNLYDSDASYMVSQDMPDKLDLNIDYENCIFSSTFSNGKFVIFDKSGTIQADCKNSDYSMSMTYNDNYPMEWFTLSISGSNANDVTLKKVDGGYILTADNLNNVEVKANNKDESVSTKFDTNFDSVFIYESDNHTLAVNVDTNNDGIYETVVNK